VDLAPVVLGCELVAAVRALRMDPDRVPRGRLRATYELAAASLSEDRMDRSLTEDLAAATTLVSGGLGG
jgi:histidine ammonia-lyase